MADLLAFPIIDARKNGEIAVDSGVIASLEEARILRDIECDIELRDVMAGERVLTTLNMDEARLFVEFMQLGDEAERIAREVLSRRYMAYSNLVKDSDDIEHVPSTYMDEAESQEYHRLVALHDYLSGMFWLSVRSRTDSFNTALSICAGLKVVVVGYKYPRNA